MSESLSWLDSPEAAQPASSEEINRIARAVLAIKDFPKFETRWFTPTSHYTRYWVGHTGVALCTPYGTDANIKLSEDMAWDLPQYSDDDTDRNTFYRSSIYDFVRSGSQRNYKLKSNLVSEHYLKKSHKEELVPAFSESFRLDKGITMSPWERHRKYKRWRKTEAIWDIGTLSVGRAQELLQLVESFDPATAKPPKRTRH